MLKKQEKNTKVFRNRKKTQKKTDRWTASGIMYILKKKNVYKTNKVYNDMIPSHDEIEVPDDARRENETESTRRGRGRNIYNNERK